MQPSSNPNFAEKLRNHPYFPKPNGNQMLPSLQHKSVSPISTPSDNTNAALNLDKAVEYELKHGRRLDPKVDKKKLRRIVSNRLSAHRARVRKAKYVNELENTANHLEDMILLLTSRIETYKENRKLLLLQNESLQRLLMIRLDEAKLSEIELENNRIKMSRLKEVERRRSKGIHDSDGQMQDLMSKQFITHHYASFGFYENGDLQKQVASSVIVHSGAKITPNYAYEQPKNNQGEAEVDQYLNLEDH